MLWKDALISVLAKTAQLRAAGGRGVRINSELQGGSVSTPTFLNPNSENRGDVLNQHIYYDYHARCVGMIISGQQTQMASQNYYELLGVGPDATEQEIKNAYRRQALKTHPDKIPNDPDAKEKFQRLGRAKDTLLDPYSRSRYNALLRCTTRPAPGRKAPCYSSSSSSAASSAASSSYYRASYPSSSSSSGSFTTPKSKAKSFHKNKQKRHKENEEGSTAYLWQLHHPFRYKTIAIDNTTPKERKARKRRRYRQNQKKKQESKQEKKTFH